MSASTAGGPTRATDYDAPSRLEPHPDVLGRHAACGGRTSGRSRCTATATPACSATAPSSGRATSSRAGRRCKHARPGRDQHRALRHPVLGHRHRRLHPHRRIHRRTARPLVPVRRVLPVVPRARAPLAPPAALGLGRRRRRTGGNQDVQAGPGGAEEPAGRADPQEVPRASIPAAAVHLHGGSRVLRDGPADHARAVAALPGRPARRSHAAISTCGAATSSSRRSSRRARRRGASTCRAAPGSTSGRRSASRAAARSTVPSISTRCRCTCAPARFSRSAPCGNTPTSRSTRL